MSDFRIVRQAMSAAAPTLGRLYAGPLTFVTLELPWKGNAPMISCIPLGTYRVAMTFSNRFQGPMPELIAVPGRTGIRFHPGVREENTEGCVLTGLKDNGDGTISGQVPGFSMFYAWVQETLAEGVVSCVVSVAS